MTDRPLILLDKRQTAPDVIDDNPFDTSPKTETEAYVEMGAQRLANEKVRHLQRTRNSITFRQLTGSRTAHPCFEMEMPAVEGQRLGLFYYTVGGEYSRVGGWKKFERCVVEGSMIEISAANRAEADRLAQEGIVSTTDHASRAFFAEEMGVLDSLSSQNPGLSVEHSYRPKR